MSAMPILPIPATEGWTVDDLDLLPDDGLHYELVEGKLKVSPPAPVRHNVVATELAVLLRPVLDRSWLVAAPGAVQLDDRNLREPDLLVVRRDGVRGDNADPADVLLAVEVMSRSSVTDDRLVKPAQYAAAGIPHYWRIEPAVPVLVTYALAGDAYRETGRHSDEVDLREPVAVRFRLADLLA
jgi:Uma2 family endonuclease